MKQHQRTTSQTAKLASSTALFREQPVTTVPSEKPERLTETWKCLFFYPNPSGHSVITRSVFSMKTKWKELGGCGCVKAMKM